MRIALVHPYSWPHTRRGGERYLHDLGWYLTSVGHDVTIISGHGGADEPGSEVIEGVTVRRAWARPGGRTRSLPPTIGERIEARRIAHALEGEWDVVHSFWPVAARAAARRFPTIYTLLGMPTAASDTALVKSLGRGSGAATIAAALSTPARHEATRLMPGRWVVLPPGLRTERFPLAPFPHGRPRILFSASLSTRYKGLPVLLRAFAEVLHRRPDAELVLSGAGSHDWALEEIDRSDRERIVANLRTPGKGSLGEADSLYGQASVMVLPSRNEAFGLSVVEALATGCPVVVSDDGGPGEIIDGADVGDAVPHDDPAAIAKAALDWIERAADPGVRAACRGRALEYDWHTSIGPLHEELYRAACRGDALLPSWTRRS